MYRIRRCSACLTFRGHLNVGRGRQIANRVITLQTLKLGIESSLYTCIKISTIDLLLFPNVDDRHVCSKALLFSSHYLCVRVYIHTYIVYVLVHSDALSVSVTAYSTFRQTQDRCMYCRDMNKSICVSCYEDTYGKLTHLKIKTRNTPR